MPAIQIDDVGTQFYYYDSGSPALKDTPYTTLVLCHGYIFNSYTLRYLLPIAAASHVRLVLLDRRGYGRSTPLDASETTPEDASASPKLYESFLKNRAKELAMFLVKFIELEEIPPKRVIPGRASGGISLAGWSLANIPVSAFLAFADTFDSALINKLDTHLRKVVQYDPPFHVTGFPRPQGTWNPLWDPEIPVAERAGRFGVWISSYWKHSPEFIHKPTPDLALLEQRNHNSAKLATVLRFTDDEVNRGVERVTYKNGDDFTVLEANRPVSLDMLRKLLFTSHDESKKPLADIEVSYVFCTETYWEAYMTIPLVKAEMASPPPGYYLHRPVRFSWIEGCNHLAHYDDPAKTFAALAQALEY